MMGGCAIWGGGSDGRQLLRLGWAAAIMVRRDGWWLVKVVVGGEGVDNNYWKWDLGLGVISILIIIFPLNL